MASSRAHGQVGPSGVAAVRIDWERLARRALLVTLFTILALYVAPAREWWRQRGELAREQRELDALERTNARLRTRVRELRTGAAVETEARGLGMVKVGERPYVILPGR